LEQHSIIQETLSPCQEHCKSKVSMQVRKDRCGCQSDRRHIHCSQICGIWSCVWYSACEFVITQIPTHSRCQHTHTQVKRETGCLNTPQLISMSSPKILCTWLLQIMYSLGKFYAILSTNGAYTNPLLDKLKVPSKPQ
jgi:hypothetical protein